jgi:hypothetical protein
MLKLRIPNFLCLSIFAITLAAQQPAGTLTNARVGDLVLAGVSPSEIIRIISTAPRVNFDLRPGSTDNLLKTGVSEEIIKAMSARETGGPVSELHISPPSAAAATRSVVNSAALPASPVAEVGVYYRMNGQWIEMMPEVVNWRVGGIVKTLATSGIVKPDRNAHLRNGKSKTPLRIPVELLVYAPEGNQITEYQLIRLHTHAHAREFRVVTGAIFHVHGDSDRDDLPFDGQHVGIRTWTISLSGLTPGEYGLLPPGMAGTRSASAQLGKMYTFTVVE